MWQSAFAPLLNKYYSNSYTKKEEPIKKTINVQKHEEPIQKQQVVVNNKIGNSIKNEDILICIFNYKHDDNAYRWLKALSPYFCVYVLDSGNDKIINDFIQFPNIYYSGLFNEFKKLFKQKNYKWGGIICSDVTVTDENINKFIDRVKWLNTTTNVGIWQAAADASSRSIHGHVTNNELIQYKLWIEGWLIFMRNDIINKMPIVSKDNLYGWNLDTVAEVISYNLNLLNIIDNNCVVHHPAERGYPENPARQQGLAWEKSVLSKLKMVRPSLNNIKQFPITYAHTNDVTFIMINRGGQHIQKVINNFKNTFNSCFSKINFIIVQQDDNTPFKRAQLINIGVKFSNSEYIGIIDNDIINLDKFNPIEIYNIFKHGYVAFDKISQLDENNKIIVTEPRLSGFGAFNFMKREDFINVNGETNLCAGWGIEDNIFQFKYNFNRYKHTLGHIYHKKRMNDCPKLTDFNKTILTKYQNKQIDYLKDGYYQLLFNINSISNNGDICYINVSNISVVPDFKYLDLYKKLKSIELLYIPKNNIKLYGMTLVYNESKMIPYIMPYYERLGFDKLVIYDNESTDNSVELLKQYPFVEIRTFKTNGKNNRIQSELKSNFYKEFIDSKNTWLYISDFDEVIYYNGNFKDYLQKKNNEGYTCLNQTMFELLSDVFPNISDGKLIHEKCKFGNIWNDVSGGAKMTLFKVDNIKNMQYSPGAHTVNVQAKSECKSLNHQEIKSFHIKYIDYNYCFEKTKNASSRRSIEDKNKGFGIQYNKLNNQDEFKTFWNNKKKNVIKLNEYLNNIYEDTSKYEKSKIIWKTI